MESNPTVEKNGPPVPLGDGRTVEMRLCSCCGDKSRPRYFVRDQFGDVIRMAKSLETAIHGHSELKVEPQMSEDGFGI